MSSDTLKESKIYVFQRVCHSCLQPMTRHETYLHKQHLLPTWKGQDNSIQWAALKPIYPLMYLNTTINCNGLEGEEQNGWIWKTPTCFGHLETEACILQHEIKLSDAIMISELLYCGKLDNWKSMITSSVMKHLQIILGITGIITDVVIKCERILDKYLLFPNREDKLILA